MESQENATQNALTEQMVEPVTTEVDANLAEQTTEPAPVTVEESEVQAEFESTATEEKTPKVVKELITQRKRRQQAEQEAAYWKGIAEGKGHNAEPVQQIKAQPATQDLKPPSISEFDTYEQYEQAKDEYLIQQAEHRVLSKQREQQVKQQVEQVQLSFRQKMDEVAEVDPFIYETVEEVGKMVSPIVAELVVQSDHGIGLVKYFKNNPKEAVRLSRLHPLIAAKEVGSLEAKLAAPKNPEPAKKVSAAPQPIKTVAPAGSTVVDEDNLPMEEYYKRRTKALYGR